MNSLSAVSLVAPYRLIGLDALSVESATTFLTPVSIAASMTFWRAEHVGLHELERVVLRGVDLLQGGGVDDVVDVVHRAQQAALVTDVADEPAQARVVVEQLADLVLLELVAGEDHESLRVEVLEGVA